MKIFVTGGAGYIGSHTCVELQNAGFELVVYDNFSNSTFESLTRVMQITGKQLSFIQGDVRDEAALEKALLGCDAVIHFAGLKAVGESVAKPLAYYDNNVHGTLCLLRVMQKLNIKKLVFSSSATVYGDPEFLPFTENHPLRTTNPYGQTKLVIEEILRDLFRSDPTWQIMILRYFNPVGAHESGLIGEDPQGIPNNLMPYIAQVAIGRRECVNVFGNDYPTRDGTGVRDYLHVVDLALGHVKALQALNKPQCTAINLGAGKGYSVLEVINAFSKVSGKEIPFEVMPRRAGDIAEFYSDPTLAQKLLGWEVEYDLDKICEDMWRFQIKNPKGYVL
ncbi:UDP-glucose 4-epimerase GalE [Sulfurospirillum halorespirans]|uniref:UDP-glucose 4-epimerase n=1 Tax=Sulfurospirillum halorespirans DSM 13726 TaxID=1193502 RepID=A0A1D7TM62_9BACT|nr:UDP-glucose 4-epimerase GalE [Sulfurospirillum halorespirans]AOO66050.1 UDP-glucose 4-epimerase [Sulfurospirillum halorespirans DSM 13726]